ncbi:lysophospholipid acyltransferase family protein [Jatrophihabitans sp.]|uniref:lysophospholipid acyltransferase family protein n=1 Tax=Jatrophihabitans sp. TaxID=1932789 RepID=UPI0030C75336|nr:phospholipid/glycerol acyltransferase [Jatrophihabitans sp.]
MTPVTGTRFWRGVNHAIISVMHLTLLLTARRRYRNVERIPAEGGVLVVSNHVSLFDAFALPHAVRSAGRNPLGMGKVELFRIPVLGGWFAKIGHVSVDRAAPSPSAALAPAAEALRQGKVLCMYPEGTINTTPELGLVPGRTGVARLALASGVPVVPIGQWGPQLALTPKGRVALLRVPRLFGWFRSPRRPRRPLCLLTVGEPISPAELLAVAGPGPEPDLRAVTDFLMARIGALVAELSGLPASATLDAGTPAVAHRSGRHQ